MKSSLKSMGIKKQGGGWKLRGQPGSALFPRDQGDSTHLLPCSVSCHSQGHDCSLLGVAWAKTVICKCLA